MHEQLSPPCDLYEQLEAQEVERASRLAYALAKDPALALRAGRELPAHMLGMPGLLVAEAPTFRAALAEFQRQWPLFCSGAPCRLLTEGDVARFVLDLSADTVAVQRSACEFVFVFLLRVGQTVVGRQTSPIRVCFPYPTPDYHAHYPEYFGCELRFDAERAELAFPSAWLDSPRAFADEVLIKVLRPEVDALLLREMQGGPMRDRVYGLFMANPTLTEGDANGLAKLLGTSVSKMRRALQEEGETLLAIADEARIDRARSLLAQSDLTIKVISERLGYSQPSAFHRAFKRKTGVSPLSFRRRATRS
jgi:AraC-like DNA-binding protein